MDKDNGGREVLAGEVLSKEDPTKEERIEGHTSCPYCGSEERVIGDFVAELKEAGVISPELFPEAAGAWEIPFMDLKKLNGIVVPGAVRTFPKLKILFDVCDECKRLYILKVEFGQGQILQQQASAQRKV